MQAAVWRQLAGGHSQAHDLCINAPTGSGKTLAYALPVLSALLGCALAQVGDSVVTLHLFLPEASNVSSDDECSTAYSLKFLCRRQIPAVRALAVLPTRDLALQVVQQACHALNSLNSNARKAHASGTHGVHISVQVFQVFALLCPAAGLRTVLVAGKASQVPCTACRGGLDMQ